MMNQLREEAVWKRVMAAAAEAPDHCDLPGESELTASQVLELLEGTLADAVTYKTLAARAAKRVRQCLLQLAREEQVQYRKLEAVYYLMTGVRPCPARPGAPCVACLNEELRKRYRRETASAKIYDCLAAKAGSYAGVFRCLAAEETRHAAMLLRLLERCV